MRYSEPSPMVPRANTVAVAATPADGPNTSIAPRFTAATMPATASMNSTTSRVVRRRASACRSKKFIACKARARNGEEDTGGTLHAATRRARADRMRRAPAGTGRRAPGSEPDLRGLAHLGLVEIGRASRRESVVNTGCQHLTNKKLLRDEL